MNILSAKYCCLPPQSEPCSIRIQCDIGVVMSVPINESNVDYQEIMRQVDEGILTIEPADEPE